MFIILSLLLSAAYLLPLPRRLCFHCLSVSVCLSVCLVAGLCKNHSTDFTEFCGKLAHGPRKNPFDFGGNPDHITLGLELGRVRVTVDFPLTPIRTVTVM